MAGNAASEALPRPRSPSNSTPSRPQPPPASKTTIAGEAPHTLLARKLDNRRSTSRLPDLLDYVISRPLVSAEMIARHLCVSSTAARDLVRTFDLHEMTGR